MFDFPTEPVDFADLVAHRKESARKTLRAASSNELRTLISGFPLGLF
jgi:hypothetical protein